MALLAREFDAIIERVQVAIREKELHVVPETDFIVSIIQIFQMKLMLLAIRPSAF
jgi:hypothetical protein